MYGCTMATATGVLAWPLPLRPDTAMLLVTPVLLLSGML